MASIASLNGHAPAAQRGRWTFRVRAWNSLNPAKHLLAIAAFSCPVGSAAGSPAAESFIVARGPAGPLNGTMLSPAVEQGPVMLIIPGSGPTDDAKALKLAGFISA